MKGAKILRSKLAILRSRLNNLQRKRASVRWGSALCTPVSIALWLLVAAFVLDWLFDFSFGSRVVLLLAWVAGGIWAFSRYSWTLLRIRESIEDMALIVEKNHRIDSDLVAALQFENPVAKPWGSSRLSEAVIDYVADFSPTLNVFEGFSYQPLPKRALSLVLTLIVFFIGVIQFPVHAAAFWNRFLLGSAHYPTKTQIELIEICGQAVPVFSTGVSPQIRIPYGQPVTVAVKCGGEVPTSGFANLSGIQNDSRNRINLRRSPDDNEAFRGEIENIADSFRVSFHFGDANSDPVEVVVVPLPLVDIVWDVTSPKYATTALKPAVSDGGSRQLSVLEGSRCDLRLTCANKRLKSARLKSADNVFDLVLVDKANPLSDTWSLPSGSPFESIHDVIKYEIQVVDQDDLSLETPISGQIRLKTDRMPRIVSSLVTRQVLPTAQPKFDYAAGDDFGIARISAIINIAREDGRTSQHEIVAKTFTEADQPMTVARGQVAIPLAQYELTKGDEVKVVLTVTDWRGEFVGQVGAGEPNSLSVTDLNGILTQTGEEDKKSAKQLDEILKRELGISSEKK